MVEEMTCGLRVQTAEAEDPSLIPHTHIRWLTNSRGDPVPLVSVNIELTRVHTCMHTTKTKINIKNKCSA